MLYDEEIQEVESKIKSLNSGWKKIQQLQDSGQLGLTEDEFNLMTEARIGALWNMYGLLSNWDKANAEHEERIKASL